MKHLQVKNVNINVACDNAMPTKSISALRCSPTIQPKLFVMPLFSPIHSGEYKDEWVKMIWGSIKRKENSMSEIMVRNYVGHWKRKNIS